MAVPSFEKIMLPVLKHLADGQVPYLSWEPERVLWLPLRREAIEAHLGSTRPYDSDCPKSSILC